ncbi:hypothetical protein [Streptomyces sp. NPDC059468]|uniref:hypothetical protein n=1 Tax=Streptomyces sp. NPDC059468 TaxID=3346845 RepID=UPI003675C2B6
MIWYCDDCNDWGMSDTEVDAAVDKQQHMNAHRGGGPAPSPADDEVPDEVTVWTVKHVAWGITAGLGLLSARFPALLGVSAVSALLTFVVTGIGDD